MKRLLCIICLVLVVGIVITPATPAQAQTTERVWDQGSVWAVTTVQTKPNMLNSYMKNLSQVWLPFTKKQMEQGDVLSYKILQVQNTRHGEADLVLMTEYKDMAVFDTSLDEFEAMAAEVMGSLEDLQTDNVAREDMRTIMSTYLTRELDFKDMDDE